MDIKVAKYFPLGLAGLAVLQEIFTVAMTFRFDVIHYVFRDGLYFSFYNLIALIPLFLKILFILAALYMYKVLNEKNIKQARLIGSGLIGIYIVRNLFTVIFGMGIWIPYSFLELFNYLVILFTIANFAMTFTIHGEGIEARVKAPRQPVYYNQPPVQQYQPPMPPAAQGGQSIPDQLAALQLLVDNGTLTQAEFKAAKQRIIGG